MKIPGYLIFTAFVALLLSCGHQRNDFSDYSRLKQGFANPPGAARPKVYWWWLNGYTDTVRMKEELLAMKEAGIGGVDIFEIGARPEGVVPAGPAFMSDSSLQHIVFAIKEASRLGLEVDLNLSSSWNAGGSWVTPQYSAKSLYCSKITVHGEKDRGKPGTAGRGTPAGSNQDLDDQSGQAADVRSIKVKLPFPEVPETDSKGRPLLIEFGADGKPVYHQELAVLAIPGDISSNDAYLDTARILNLSRFFDPETEELSWKAPEGEWDIYRYVCSSSGETLKLPSPKSTGPIIDHFDSNATRFHFMHFINKLQPLLGDFRKTGLKNFYLASFEATGRVWTPSMADAFREINGYELHKFLPWFFDKEVFDPRSAEDFKRDFDLTVSELMINNHYRKGSEIAGRYGLGLISESGGPGPPLHNVPVEAIKALGALNVPRGEFWMKTHKRHDGTADSIDLLMLVKEIAAASHIYGKKAAELEAFTSFQHWQEGPGDMKPIGDRAFCEGMSRPVIHGFSHNPAGTGYPGIVYGAGTHYNDKTTWFAKARPFNDYLARISYVFQEASFTADVLYYYGDRTPNFATPKNTRFAVGSGYDYEIVNTEILKKLEVKDGELVLPGGAEFSVLVLGEVTGKIPGVWNKLLELAREGAIITGKKPEKIPGELPADSWTSISGSGFGKEKLNEAKGKILFGAPVPDILKTLDLVPDFDYADKGSQQLDYQHASRPFLDYIHYREGDLDFYFVRNTSGEWISRNCSFRQQGKSPELWDPVSGKVVPVTIYEENGKQMDIPLTLPPYGSCFIVFRKKAGNSHYQRILSPDGHPPLLVYTKQGIQFLKEGVCELTNNSEQVEITSQPQIFPIDGAWRLTFPPGWGAPDSVTFPELISWTAADEEGIKYFSGTGTYHKKFLFTGSTRLPDRQRVYLDLGSVSEVAEVWLNSKPLGISWTPPYRYDVTELIRQGENNLKIEVVNTWSNRIVGDAITGGRFTSTNLTAGSQTNLTSGDRETIPWTETPLAESGLLGPVRVEVVEAIGLAAATGRF